VEKVLEDHHLPKRLAQFMPEDHVSDISDAMDELFGLHPSSWTLVEQTAETILRLAELGNVILIGRGANVVTAKLDYVFHVRLVASVDKRAEYLQDLQKISRKTALEMIRREDRGRARYLSKHYGADINDPLSYHLVINTERVGYEHAARISGNAMLGRTEIDGEQSAKKTRRQ
jgi:cytidylate kinase